jgi:hypothetical protein
MTEGHIEVAPPRKTLFMVLGGGLLVATAILVGAVLPAEYHIDPLGIGKATGLLQMSRPAEAEVIMSANAASTAVANFYTTAFRTDTVEIPLAAAGDADHRDQLEWKVRMKVGDTLVYSWRADVSAEQFYVDFHGQTDPTPDVKVLTYKKGQAATDSGAMVAQFDGIHGWYLQNQSEQPVIMHLKLSGFYEMRPDPSAAE